MTKHNRSLYIMAIACMALLMSMGCNGSKQQTTPTVDSKCYEVAAPPIHSSKCSKVQSCDDVCNEEYIQNKEMMCTRLFQVKRYAPECGAVDEELPIDIEITALHDVSEVVIRDIFSKHVNIIRTSPPAKIDYDDNEIVWNFDALNEGDCKLLRVWVTSDVAGDLVDCVTVSALPRVCVSTFIGKCCLCIKGCGPECLCLHECGYYSLKIGNTGSAVARDVIATCIIPRGMNYSDGDSEISWRLGDIDKGCEETISFSLEAVEAGNQNLIIKAVASNHCEVTETFYTKVVQPRLAVSCSAAEEQFIGRDAEVAITVTNTCTIDLSNVVVTDNVAPCEATIVRAPNGKIFNNQIVWEIDRLGTGRSHVCHVAVCHNQPCKVTHNVHVTGGSECCPQPCETCSVCSTLFKGHPGLLIEMIDTCDPMLVGEVGTYRIRVTNQGTAADEDVYITATFPMELEPLNTRGSTEGNIAEQVVTFEPYTKLDPCKSIEYAIEAKAKNKGDARVKVELFSKLLHNPVTEEESTYIY